MKTIDQYILKEWLVLFFGCLIFLISFLCIFSIAEDITNVFPKETDSIFIDLVHWSWYYLPWLLPISALFSSLFLTGFLKEWRVDCYPISRNFDCLVFSLGAFFRIDH